MAVNANIFEKRVRLHEMSYTSTASLRHRPHFTTGLTSPFASYLRAFASFEIHLLESEEEILSYRFLS